MIPVWLPRIPYYKLRNLYELDAKGIWNDRLVDDVGNPLLSK